jgi:hypothetical protein
MRMQPRGGPLKKYAAVTVDAAAELVNVDAGTIRYWSELGSVEIEWRGDMEVVRLDQVRAVASSNAPRRPARRREGLRRRLEGATVEDLDITDLQQLARDRSR